MAEETDDALAPRRRFQLIRRLARHRSFRIGFIIVAALTLAAIFAPLISKFDPFEMRARIRFRPPQAAYWFGTDNFGRDVFTRCLYGARLSLTIGLGTALLSGAIGAAAGIASAQFRRIDAVMMRLMDGLMAFPAIILAIGLAAAMGPQIGSLIIALSVA